MKRYQEIWTQEVFIIDAIVYGNPTIYKIKNRDNEPIKGTSYFQFTSVDCGTQDVPSQESGSKDKEGQSCIA